MSKNYVIFIAIVLVSVFLTIDMTAPWHKPKKFPTYSLPDKTDFLLKEYDAAVREIDVRIEEEHNLFLQKIIFVGVVLGSISLSQVKREKHIEISQLMLLCCWTAVAVAAIMDVRLMFNVIIIGDHGVWIRQVETIILQSKNGLPGWEAYFQESSNL